MGFRWGRGVSAAFSTPHNARNAPRPAHGCLRRASRKSAMKSAATRPRPADDRGPEACWIEKPRADETPDHPLDGGVDGADGPTFRGHPPSAHP